jgi:hypothetical protein
VVASNTITTTSTATAKATPMFRSFPNRCRPTAYAQASTAARRRRHVVRLMDTLPAAEAVGRRGPQYGADVMEIGAHIDDVTDSSRAETASTLWPLYLDDLRRDGTPAVSARQTAS